MKFGLEFDTVVSRVWAGGAAACYAGWSGIDSVAASTADRNNLDNDNEDSSSKVYNKTKKNDNEQQ